MNIDKILFVLLLSYTILACTTLAHKDKLLEQSYKEINRSDGIDRNEASLILRYQLRMGVEVKASSIDYNVSRGIEEYQNYWLFTLMSRSVLYSGNGPTYTEYYRVAAIHKEDGELLEFNVPILPDSDLSKKRIRDIKLLASTVNAFNENSQDQAIAVAEDLVYLYRINDYDLKYYVEKNAVFNGNKWEVKLIPYIDKYEPIILLIGKYGSSYSIRRQPK